MADLPLPTKLTLGDRSRQTGAFNWGVNTAFPELWRVTHAIELLQRAQLDDQDIAFIEGLTLGGECSDQVRDEFSQLMHKLRNHYGQTGLDTGWVAQLLNFVPPFTYDSKKDGFNATVVRYINDGFGAPLTALYLLTLRSEYWQTQLSWSRPGQTDPISEVLERKRPETRGYGFAEILGDPFRSPLPASWESAAVRTDFFLLRQEFDAAYFAVLESDPAWEQMRAVCEAMMLLSSIAAEHIGDRLKEYINQYDGWENECIFEINGGSIPPIAT